MTKNQKVTTGIVIGTVLIVLLADALVLWAIAVAFANNGICFRTVLALVAWFGIRRMPWSKLIENGKKYCKMLDEIDEKRECVTDN